MKNNFCESFDARPLHAVRAAAVGLVALLGACSEAPDDPWEDASEEAFETLEQAPFDSNDIRVTAGSAMVVAYERTLADGDRFEYCGLIVRKANGDFRAGQPATSRQIAVL